ncbi:MAG: hypothetical protein JNL18_24940 [Planctomycetaceae bacterium]|jgi:hypothetical protein|uniref:Uncharacterized protein n=1 Tax=Lacipirellula limnantheis TaxID=2528024 RepID=A0A517TTV8_9BACT|nr:hypothetical protein [Lacipirellula limnantheis]MBL9165992.1 hypothetical protein [Planctomycetaceae bacterium]QDT71796.1 hypothetical protein I41_09560 [Lacipirellula limnantheis]
MELCQSRAPAGLIRADQRALTNAVAAATGESRFTIATRGFSSANPIDVDFDPEPAIGLPYLDWDGAIRE